MSFSGYPQVGASTSSASSASGHPPTGDPGGDDSSGGGGTGGHGPSPGDSPGASQSWTLGHNRYQINNIEKIVSPK